ASSNTDLVNRVNTPLYPNGMRADVTKIPNALNQFMPRIGVAWSPGKDQRLVVRAHGGIFYAASPLLIFSDPTGNFRTPANNFRLYMNNTAKGTIDEQFLAAGVDLDPTPLDKLPIPALTAVSQAASFGLGTAPDPYAGAGTTAVATDFRNPRSYQTG